MRTPLIAGNCLLKLVSVSSNIILFTFVSAITLDTKLDCSDRAFSLSRVLNIGSQTRRTTSKRGNTVCSS